MTEPFDGRGGGGEEGMSETYIFGKVEGKYLVQMLYFIVVSLNHPS